ncbi:hypothetical protein AXF42_Ash011617 [Apostasia shenzhenica]|uniref:J domain-containing protein n=1 Tax=Apostasia shenzhenica TaxID=1088818 RepID=A0A2I0BB42_9ASPA|nr:hypothetical protein AXF42_Ash011617 [Apostasia shenzhenica]
MGGTAAGASRSGLPFLFDPSSAASAFGPIKRLPLAPGLRAYSRIIISPFRLRPRCRSRNRDGIKFESNGSHARISEEEQLNDWVSLPSASPYQILGVDPTSCSPTELKAAFRSRVKEFHPDVYKGKSSSNEIICRIIDAYKVFLAYF